MIQKRKNRTRRKGMRMKGVSMVFIMAMVAMLGLAISIAIFFLFYGQMFVIIPIIKENEIQRHSIILANLFMSSDKLAYSDGYRSYRAVLDKSKLDKEMVNQGNALSFLNIFHQTDLFKEISYPNSVVTLAVVDNDNGNSWYVSGTGQIQGEGTSVQSYFECMVSHIRLDPASIFRAMRPTGPPIAPIKALWTDYDFNACYQVLSSKAGVVAFQTFPVSIRYSDNDIHLGTLSLSLAEI